MARVVVFDEPGAPEVMRVVEQPLPQPGPGEVRIKLDAFGINRLDLLARSGTAPRPSRLPQARLGIEGTGTIDAVGPGVETRSPGDAVIIAAVPEADMNGTYAEYTTVPASRTVARPDGLAPTDAAALWVAHSTAYGALIEKAGMRPGDQVLITAAASGVGLAAIQVANQIGAVPIAVTRHAAKRAALRDAGAAFVIATDEDDLLESVQTLTEGAGVEIILDSVMGPGLADMAKAARFGGTLVTVGWLDPRPATVPASAITIHRYMSFEHTLDPTVVRRIAAFLGAGLRSGVLKPIVDRVFTLDEIVEAHRYLAEGDHVGKLVVAV